MVTEDGAEREVDVIVVATGFHTTDQPIAHHITGRDGRTLADTWQSSGMRRTRAPRSRVPQPVPDRRAQHRPRPLLDGLHHRVPDRLHPRRAPAHGSARHRRGRAAAARPGGVQRGRAAPDAAHGVETGGCASWYLDAYGRNTTLWPRTTVTFREMLRSFDVEPYEVEAPASPPPREGGPRMRSLESKVVVITGAGSGIGRAMAVRPPSRARCSPISDWNAEGSARPSTCARRPAPANCAVTPSTCPTARPCDVGDAVAGQFGRVNMVVNNAGVTMTGEFEQMSYEEFDWIVGVNLKGVVNGTKEFLPHLIASGDGDLVNISSLFGLMMPGQTAYNATKYAVRGFTEAIREEMLVGGHAVTVTCVHPGGIKTGISRNGRKTAETGRGRHRQPLRDRLARMAARRRRGSSSVARSRARPGCWSDSTPISCTMQRSWPGRDTRTSWPGSRRRRCLPRARSV